MLRSAYMHIRAREISFWKYKKPKRWRRRRKNKNDKSKFIRACWSQLHMHCYSSFWLCLTLTRLFETCHIHTYMETDSLKYQSNFFTFLLLFFCSYLSLSLYVFFHFGKQKEKRRIRRRQTSTTIIVTYCPFFFLCFSFFFFFVVLYRDHFLSCIYRPIVSKHITH